MQNFFLPASERQHHHALTCKAAVTADISALAKQIAILALRSLHAELVLYPKPGLVSLRDNGSHTDMTAMTFFRSLFSLRHYFLAMANAGMGDGDFQTLKSLGIVAEQKMLRATHGVNTHRGAIFCLGLLCAAAGRCLSQGLALRAQNIRAALLEHWGVDLIAHSNTALKFAAEIHPHKLQSHGLQVAQSYAISGAREEAAAGFPSVFELALPRLMQSLDQGRSQTEAQIDSLFVLMAHMHDTNLYYRGGVAAAEFSRQSARVFLAAGGTEQADWLAQAERCHREFVQRRLSPGGAADLLAASWFIYQAQQMSLPPAYA